MAKLLSSFVLALLAATAYSSHQTYPGTATRPILSDSEAATLSESNYLQGWSPEGWNIPGNGDYIVGSGQAYSDIQAAVNAAIKDGGSTRKYIEIKPGTYAQTVYVTGSVPLTIFGSGTGPAATNIQLSQPADMSTSAYINQVNPNGQRYKEGDPAYNIYHNCATASSGVIGTTCSSIFWITADNVQVYNLQVTNVYTSNGEGQSVALKIDADKTHVSNVNLVSRQDTLYAGSGKAGVLQRAYFENTFIEGDVDFVFGGASAVFDGVTFTAISERHPSGAVVFAPNTNPSNSFGFLVINSVITGDAGFKSSKKVNLARSWDSNTSSGQYQPGVSPNGQLLISNTRIDGVVNADAPYTTSTSSRTFSGDVATSRNLNDNNYNRFWEYKNSGDGA